MDREALFAWASARYGTEPEYPWNDNNVVLRHRENNKWYAVVLEVCENKLGRSGERTVDVLNLKCDPNLVGSLRMQEGFYPAYHMNKEKWISVILDGTVSDETIKELVEMSYAESLGKKRSRACVSHPK